MIVGSSECCKSLTTLFSVVEMVIMVKTAANFGMNQGWLFGFCWYFFFFCRIKLSIPETIHSEIRDAILKKTEMELSAM